MDFVGIGWLLLREETSVLMSSFELFILLLNIVEPSAHHSLGGVLLEDGSNGLVVVDLLLPLHGVFDSAQLVLDSVLKGYRISNNRNIPLMLLTVLGFSPLIFRYMKYSELTA